MYRFGLLIPSKGRSDYLARIARFYVESEAELTLIIGDASRYSCEMELKQITDKSNVSLHYFHWTELNDRRTIASLSDEACKIGCDYVAFTGDDDFLFPNAIAECCEFLAQDSSYTSAQGLALLVDATKIRRTRGSRAIFDYWGRPNLRDEPISRRFKRFSKKYFVLQFSVHRSDQFNKSCQIYKLIKDRNWGEIYHCYYLALQGKSHFLNMPFLVRTTSPRVVHESRNEWIESGIWDMEKQFVAKSLFNAFPSLPYSEIEDELNRRYTGKKIPFHGLVVTIKRKILFTFFRKRIFMKNKYFLLILKLISISQ